MKYFNLLTSSDHTLSHEHAVREAMLEVNAFNALDLAFWYGRSDGARPPCTYYHFVEVIPLILATAVLEGRRPAWETEDEFWYRNYDILCVIQDYTW